MSTTQTIGRERHDQVLEDAVAHERPLVLTYNSDAGWRTFKAAFVSGPAVSSGILVKLEPAADGVVGNLPTPGDTLGGTFRLGHKKCMFSTVLLSVQRQGEDILWAIRRPEQLQQLQRRAYERAAPPKGSVIAVRFWREAAGGDASTDVRNVRHGQLEDISAGGMRIKVADPKDMSLDRTYRCVFTPRPGKPSLVLDAVLRHREAVDQGRASLGFQFVGMEATPEGLRLLDRLVRIVNHFQRSNARDLQSG
ncbi:MAG: PilZ domain-containing protein [Planctomycetota bacterium]